MTSYAKPDVGETKEERKSLTNSKNSIVNGKSAQDDKWGMRSIRSSGSESAAPVEEALATNVVVDDHDGDLLEQSTPSVAWQVYRTCLATMRTVGSETQPKPFSPNFPYMQRKKFRPVSQNPPLIQQQQKI
jgi:hypothetical protein